MEAFGRLYDATFQDRIATVRDLQDRLGELHDCDVWIEMLQFAKRQLTGLDALLHDRMEARIGGYGELCQYVEKSIDEEFFSDLLVSLVPDASPTLPHLGGMTKIEQVKAVTKQAAGRTQSTHCTLPSCH